MSFVYSSNSPEFLNYIAHTKTRNDILNDPRLCVLLEDPYIKDNMELALHYHDAQYGNYEAKKEFIGFFLANGPELDTDTIMYFREKILHNPTYTEIYQNEFKNNIGYIDDLRINMYGKDTSDTNELKDCLSNPCDYLGPFSSSIGLMGDEKNFNTLSNMFARLNGDGDDSGEKDESCRIWGNIPQHMVSKLIPNLEVAYRTVLGHMSAAADEFTKKLENAGLSKEMKTTGDPKAEARAKDVASAVKVNVVSNLGDCYRIWESMRRLRVYDPSKNTKQPFEPVSKKTPDGNPAPNYTPLTDVELKPKPVVTSEAISGTTNTAKEEEKRTLNGLASRYKQSYVYYRYFLDNHRDKFNDYEIEIMEDFIAGIDNYIAGEDLGQGLPTSFAPTSKLTDELSREVKIYEYKGLLTEEN